MSWNKRLSDQQARGDIKRFHQALVDYKAMTGSYPPGHAIPDCEHPVHKPQYDELMTRLMSAGVLPEPLAHPARRSQGFGYCYGVLYKDDKPVPLVWTWLQSSPLNNAGEPGTCRPFEKAWACSSGVANHDYCLCLP